MLADDALDDPAYQSGVALRVDALAADQAPHLLVELLDQLPVVLRARVGRRHRHGWLSRE